MSLVYAGALSHAPGITGRADLANNIERREEFYAALGKQRQDIEESGAEALVVIAAEHFGNFFMNNMPAFCIGLGETYTGPIEDPEWLKIPKTTIPGAPGIARKPTEEVMQTVDTAYAEEWRFDHGIMVPLHFLTPEYGLPIIPVNINCQGPPLTHCIVSGHLVKRYDVRLIRSRRRSRLLEQAAFRTGRQHRTPEDQ